MPQRRSSGAATEGTGIDHQRVMMGHTLRERRIAQSATQRQVADMLARYLKRELHHSTVARLESGKIDPHPFIAAYDALLPLVPMSHAPLEGGKVDGARIPLAFPRLLQRAIRTGVQQWRQNNGFDAAKVADTARSASAYPALIRAYETLVAEAAQKPGRSLVLVTGADHPAVIDADAPSRAALEQLFSTVFAARGGRASGAGILHFQRLSLESEYAEASLAAIESGVEWSMAYQRLDVPRERDEVTGGSYRFLTIEANRKPVQFPIDLMSIEGGAAFMFLPGGTGNICTMPWPLAADVPDREQLDRHLVNLQVTAKESVLVFPPSPRAAARFNKTFSEHFDARFLLDRPFFSTFCRPPLQREPGRIWWREMTSRWKQSYPGLSQREIEAEVRDLANSEMTAFRRWEHAILESGGRFAQLVSLKAIRDWADTGERTDREGAKRLAQVDRLEQARDDLEYLDRVIQLLRDLGGMFQIALGDHVPTDDYVGVATQGGHHVGFEADAGKEFAYFMSGFVRNAAVAKLATDAIEAKIRELPEAKKAPRHVIDVLQRDIRPRIEARLTK